MSESKIEKDSNKYARSIGWLHIKAQGRSNENRPDDLYVKNHAVFFVEFKKSDEPLRKTQEIEIDKICKAYGCSVYIIDSFREFKIVIDNEDLVLQYQRNMFT